MKTKEMPVDSDDQKLAKLAIELKRLISLSATCDYYLSSLSKQADAKVSFDAFSPKQLLEWSRSWASSNRFEKNGALQQVLQSTLGKGSDADISIINNLSFCYTDTAQKLMFDCGEYESNKDYLAAFSDACREEIDQFIVIRKHVHSHEHKDSKSHPEHEIFIDIDDYFFIVTVTESLDEKGAVSYSIKSEGCDGGSQNIPTLMLMRRYIKDIAVVFACAVWAETTGKGVTKMIEKTYKGAY